MQRKMGKDEGNFAQKSESEEAPQAFDLYKALPPLWEAGPGFLIAFLR